MACRLKKALCGLKQSSRAWFGRFSQAIKKYGYSHSDGDHSLFYKHSNKAKVISLTIYVDDVIIIENDSEEKDKLE